MDDNHVGATYRSTMAAIVEQTIDHAFDEFTAVEINWFRQIYNTIRPHQALGDRTPRQAYQPRDLPPPQLPPP